MNHTTVHRRVSACIILSVILTVLLLQSSVIFVSAAAAYDECVIPSALSNGTLTVSIDAPYGIVDPDQVMTEFSVSELDQVNDALKQVYDNQNVAAYMYVTTQTGMNSGYEAYIDRFHDLIPYEDSVIFFIGYKENDHVFRIDSYGPKASDYINNSRAEKIANGLDDTMRAHEFTESAVLFAQMADHYLGIKPMLDSIVFRWYVQLPVILLIVLIVILLRIRSMGAKVTTTPVTYLDDNASDIIGSFDHYTHTTVTRVRKPDDSDSSGGGGGGGGGHSSSSGHSF